MEGMTHRQPLILGRIGRFRQWLLLFRWAQSQSLA